eukprot:30012-Eustigmatos_ZCMA.PRE.1
MGVGADVLAGSRTLRVADVVQDAVRAQEEHEDRPCVPRALPLLNQRLQRLLRQVVHTRVDGAVHIIQTHMTVT